MNQADALPGSDQASRRQAREFHTMAVMLGMYCRRHHAPSAGSLCPACQDLHDYARRRLERCVFGEDKPTCAHCTVHCYKPAMREQVRRMMAWAGPRMLSRHPVLAIRHIFDGRRPAPTLTARDKAAMPRPRAAATPPGH